MKNFLDGFVYPIKSIKYFFSHPKIIAYSIIPMFLNLIIYTVIFVITYLKLIGWLENLTGISETDAGIWIKLLHIVLLIITFLLLLFICYLLFTVFGGLVSAPFNENISTLVEENIHNQKSGNKLSFWKDALLSIKCEIQKLAFYLSILFLIFLLNFIPFIGSAIAFILGILFSFYYNALDFLDYPMTRKQYTFRTKLRIVQKGKMLSFGFGAMAFLLMFLPVVNVFMKPVLVVAGTGLFFERKYDELLS